MRGEYQGFVFYRQKRQCNENITNCRGEKAFDLPTGCPRSIGFWQGFAGQKVIVGVSDQVRHKPDCTAIEDGLRLEI